MIIEFRIFIAAPSEMEEQRKAVRDVVAKLSNDPLLRNRVALRPISWSSPNGTVPMLARHDPQEAISQNLPRPCDCDFAVVILGSHLGHPLPDRYADELGLPEVTGTEWEYYDAMSGTERAVHPTEVLLYRHRCDAAEDARGRRLVEFFQKLEDLKRGYNQFDETADFAENLEHHLRSLIAQRLEQFADAATIARWVESPTTPLPHWVPQVLGDVTQEKTRRSAVAKAVGMLICANDDIDQVLTISETLGENSGGFETAEQLRLHYAKLFPFMTQSQGGRAVTVFESLAHDDVLTEEQRKEVAAGAGRMASLLPVLAEDRPTAEN